MENREENRERSFSIELKSRAHLKSIRLTDDSLEDILITGVLGELKQAGFADGVLLEVVGSSGVLRIDLAENEIKKTPATGVE